MKLFKAVIPDIIAISGIGLIGYGLYLYTPWVSFSVVGLLLLVFGVLLGRGEVKK